MDMEDEIPLVEEILGPKIVLLSPFGGGPLDYRQKDCKTPLELEHARVWLRVIKFVEAILPEYKRLGEAQDEAGNLLFRELLEGTEDPKNDEDFWRRFNLLVEAMNEITRMGTHTFPADSEWAAQEVYHIICESALSYRFTSYTPKFPYNVMQKIIDALAPKRMDFFVEFADDTASVAFYLASVSKVQSNTVIGKVPDKLKSLVDGSDLLGETWALHTFNTFNDLTKFFTKPYDYVEILDEGQKSETTKLISEATLVFVDNQGLAGKERLRFRKLLGNLKPGARILYTYPIPSGHSLNLDSKQLDIGAEKIPFYHYNVVKKSRKRKPSKERRSVDDLPKKRPPVDTHAIFNDPDQSHAEKVKQFNQTASQLAKRLAETRLRKLRDKAHKKLDAPSCSSWQDS